MVLTGTPAPNGYEDLYNLFKFIWPSKNVIGYRINQLCDITNRGDINRVNRLIDNIAPYFIRIKKSDLNIPAATNHSPIMVQMSPIQQRIPSLSCFSLILCAILINFPYSIVINPFAIKATWISDCISFCLILST